MPNPIARIRRFWNEHGEWVLLAAVFIMALNAGYGLAARDFQQSVLTMQVVHQEELAREKSYLRDVIAKKNDDIRRLQGIQGDLAKDAGSTARSSTEAVKAISESNSPK